MGFIVELLATGAWVHGVTAYTLAGIWGITYGDALGLYDHAAARFAATPGGKDTIIGLGYARLSDIARRAMAHRMTVVKSDGDGGFFTQEVPDPQYRDAIRATEAAHDLAMKGDPEGTADDAAIDRMLDELERLGMSRRLGQ